MCPTGRDIDFKGAGIDFGEEFAPQLQPEPADNQHNQERSPAEGNAAMPEAGVQQSNVPLNSAVDEGFPFRKGPA